MSNRLEPEPIPRRDFLGLTGLWAAAIAVFGTVIGMAKLAKPRVLPEAGARFRVGHPEEFPPGTKRALPKHKVQIRSEEKGIAAVSLVCTHLGCIVAPSETGYDCPCHGSKFGHEGEVIQGPAPVGLRWLEVSQAAEGSLVVDASREVPEGTFYTV